MKNLLADFELVYHMFASLTAFRYPSCPAKLLQ